jgi:hypothetical protein
VERLAVGSGRGFDPYRQPDAVVKPRSMADCELCQLAQTTKWYAEVNQPFRFVIIDCDSCDVPMAVLGTHRAAPLPEERLVMQETLARIADTLYPQGWFFDDHMRQIPDHYHLHARPYPAWWRKRQQSGAGGQEND